MIAGSPEVERAFCPSFVSLARLGRFFLLNRVSTGGVMNTTLYVAFFVAALVFGSTALEYWLSLARGMSRESSLHESAIAGTFLTSSAVVSYIVTLVS
jgi:hypothetical protein